MARLARLAVVALGILVVTWWWRLRTGAARMAVGAARPSWPPLPGQGGAAPPTDGLDPPSRPVGRGAAPTPAWVRPTDDGSCPVGHPVKAKEGSGIFHPPDGRLYERTNADRCYLDAAAALADGFRRSQV